MRGLKLGLGIGRRTRGGGASFSVNLTGLSTDSLGLYAEVGDHLGIGYTINPDNGTETVKWSNSSNPADPATYGTGAAPTDYTAGDGGTLYLHVTEGDAFSPLSLFASGEAGGWYDPSDLSTLYQDSVGTTPVTAAGQPVGLVLDKSQGLTLGAELVTNGGFDSGASWTGAAWTISGGVASHTGASGFLIQNIAGIAFKALEVTITVVSGIAYLLGSQYVDQVSLGVGTHTVLVVSKFNYLSIYSDTGTGTTIDNISARELPGNHLTQATAAARPVYQTAGGLHWLEFDGVDDFLNTPLGLEVRAVTLFTGVEHGGTGLGHIFAGTVSSSVEVSAPGAVAGTYRGRANAGTTAAATSSASYASLTNVATFRANADTPIAELRINGVQDGVVTTTHGAGLYGSLPVNPYFVGKRSDGFFFGSKLYQLIVREADSSLSEMESTETYLAAKTGVTL